MDNLRADIAIRLVEERTKTGYSQADFARKLDISREGLRLYEMGQRGISAEFLSSAAALGVDVQYVLTGIHSQNQSQASQAMQPAVNVSPQGSANVVQFAQPGASINMVTTQRYVTTTKADVKPGVEHITEKQAAKLTELVKTILELEGKVKKKPASYRSVWGALNSHCGVTKYRLIPLDLYPKAEKYLYQWIGRLNSTATAKNKDNSEWRKRKYSYIKINIKGMESWFEAYLFKKFQVSSIADLTDDELDTAYKAVAAKKRSLKL